jgi:hypothetical protein
MRHITIFLSLLVALYSCQKSRNPVENISDTTWTRAELASIAAKYGLRDSVYAAKTFYGHMPDSAIWTGNKVEQWEAFFAHWSDLAKMMKEHQEFTIRRKTIRNVAEFYALLESYPHYFKSHIESYADGITGYNKSKQDALSQKWHIYISDEDGSNVFLPANDDDGTFPGKRIDDGQ